MPTLVIVFTAIICSLFFFLFNLILFKHQSQSTPNSLPLSRISSLARLKPPPLLWFSISGNVQEEHGRLGGGERNMSAAMLEENDDILTEILLHLPMKVKVQCKVVCKRWFHLISSSYFANRVFEREQNMVSISGQNPPWDLLYKYYFSDGKVNAAHLGLHVAFDLIPAQRNKLGALLNDEKMRLLAVENGLILCCRCDGIHTSRHIEYYVCNPITGKWVSLPKPQVHNYILTGFIVTCNNGDTKFKVVRLIHHEESGVSNFEVFSSDDGEWRDTGVTCPDLKIITFVMAQTGVICKEILHWISGRRMIAYDSDKNQCRFMAFNKPGFPMGILGTSGGCLCYLNADLFHTGRGDISVWVLDNYESEEWQPKLVTQTSSVLDANEIRLAGFNLLPLAFHPFDMDTVYFESRSPFHAGMLRKILSFNLRTQKLVSFSKEIELPRGCYVKGSIFPFVLPPWPTLLPHPTWETTD